MSLSELSDFLDGNLIPPDIALRGRSSGVLIGFLLLTSPVLVKVVGAIRGHFDRVTLPLPRSK